MKLNIQEILQYFDIKESTDYGDTTAAIAIVGEDLGASLFQHYCENEWRSKVQVIDANKEIPTTGRKKGPRLDRWILERVGDQQILYQAEVKSWCARAIGGSNIPLDISDEALHKLTSRNWNKVLETLNSGEINFFNKVLIEMKNDIRLKIKGEYKKEPLLIFWDAKSPDKNVFLAFVIFRKSILILIIVGFSPARFISGICVVKENGNCQLRYLMPTEDLKP